MSAPHARVLLFDGSEALVDAGDLDLVSALTWYISRTSRTSRYAIASVRRGHQSKVHRLILGIDDPAIEVDHVNGNGLDNRRSNLRIATHAENQWNRRPQVGGSSEYKGVCLHRGVGKWQAQITVSGRRIYLGVFDDELEAARAYDAAALEHYGEFARPNFGAAA